MSKFYVAEFNHFEGTNIIKDLGEHESALDAMKSLLMEDDKSDRFDSVADIIDYLANSDMEYSEPLEV